jgi:hypothetical protein
VVHGLQRDSEHDSSFAESSNRTKTYVFGADALVGVIQQTFPEEVEALGRRGREKVSQGRLGELADRDVIREFGVSLRKGGRGFHAYSFS